VLGANVLINIFLFKDKTRKNYAKKIRRHDTKVSHLGFVHPLIQDMLQPLLNRSCVEASRVLCDVIHLFTECSTVADPVDNMKGETVGQIKIILICKG
jgi:hypothetical protein